MRIIFNILILWLHVMILYSGARWTVTSSGQSGEPLNMSTSKTSSQSAIFTENGQKIYDLAFRLSDAYESFFVGTEHLLLAVLTHKDKAFRNKNNRTCAWLQSAFDGIDIRGIIQESRRFIEAASDPNVGKSTTQNVSPSLARAVIIAQRIRRPSGLRTLIVWYAFGKRNRWDPKRSLQHYRESCWERVQR